jgi:hypothetical protein
MDVVRHRVLFHLLQAASGAKDWRDPFEVTIHIANNEHDAPVAKEAVHGIMQEMLKAIEFYHGAAMAIDVETMEVRRMKGQPVAYALFDGYKLVIGSTGYAA